MELDKCGALAIDDSYETGVRSALLAPPIHATVHRERLALVAHLSEIYALWLQLEATVRDIDEGIRSLQIKINPESH